MKVANIISDSQINVSEYFNVIKSMDDVIVGLPTLIIGYDYVDKHYSNLDITKMCLSKNLYWTFKKTEKRDKYQEGLNLFTTIVYDELIKDVKYVFIDFILYSSKILIKIIRKLFSLKNVISYKYNDMIYVYSDNLIFGIDLKLLKYLGVDINKIKNKIISNSIVFLEGKKVFNESENIIEAIGDKVRFTPFLYSILMK